MGKTAIAIVDLVSLAATSELAANGDFLLKNNQLVGWNLVPELAPGFRATRRRKEFNFPTRQRPGRTGANDRRRERTAVYTSVSGRSDCGCAVRDATDRIALARCGRCGAWRANVALDLLSGVDTAIASGTAPKDSTNVELHVVVPPKTTLHVKQVSLRHTTTTTVPVKFIAEAPGDLTVSDVQLSFEQSEPWAPAIGPGGLCNAPRRREVSPAKERDSCYCHKCRTGNAHDGSDGCSDEAGRPATKARCSSCKSQVVRAGGPLIVGVEALSRQSTGAPVMVSSVGLNLPIPESQAVGPAPQLTDIRGIGQARAKQLTEIGIDSVAKLAASTPETVAKIKFITPLVAAQIISQAKSRST